MQYSTTVVVNKVFKPVKKGLEDICTSICCDQLMQQQYISQTI